MKLLLQSLSFLYKKVARLRNSLYDCGILRIYKAPIPVVSIGNLTMGGTGKTPIVDYCLKALVTKGKKVGVISRSYRAEASSPCRVDIEAPFAAQHFGDEPVLLAQRNPEVAVFVGPCKWKTARYAISQQSLDVLVVDDGFQHRKLYRDLDIVILDTTEDLTNYAILPLGRAREEWDSLKRANMVVLTKCNLSSSEDLKALQELIPNGKEVTHFDSLVFQFVNVGSGQVLEPSDVRGKKVFLVSAIARPDVFEKMMREMAEVHESCIHYRDHHQYSSQDVLHIEKKFALSQADLLVATEKDIVKLRYLVSNPYMLWSATLKVAERGQKGRLDAAIDQVFG